MSTNTTSSAVSIDLLDGKTFTDIRYYMKWVWIWREVYKHLTHEIRYSEAAHKVEQSRLQHVTPHPEKVEKLRRLSEVQRVPCAYYDRWMAGYTGYGRLRREKDIARAMLEARKVAKEWAKSQPWPPAPLAEEA